MALLATRELCVRYGPIEAVRAVSLEVERGEVVSLVGPNGAGKSSTLTAIARLTKVASGSIELEGRSLIGVAPEEVVRCGIAMVPEGRRIFTSMTVEENLRLGMTSQGRKGRERGYDDMLERFPVLRKYLHANAGKLSGGEQQQVAIARALLARPRILLLDEPSLGLSPRNVDLVFELLRELKGEGVTMLLVEQNARKALEIADRVYVIAAGTVRHHGKPSELSAGDALERAYLGDEEA